MIMLSVLPVAVESLKFSLPPYPYFNVTTHEAAGPLKSSFQTTVLSLSECQIQPAKCSMSYVSCVACCAVCISQSALAAPCVGLVQHKAQYRYLPRVPVACQRPSQGRVLWPHAWLSTIKRYLFLIISATLKPMVTRPRAHWFPLSTFLCFTYLSLFYTPSPNFVLVITRLPFPTLRAEGREFYNI